jgi:TorA maturation chaperone TorD
MVTDPSTLSFLSHLWLHEPDAAAVARANALGIAAASLDIDPATLAVAYTDLFILNVHPYGSAYTDEWGELNTSAVRRTAALYDAHGFQPPELSEVGAPDHLGLCLGFLGWLLAPADDHAAHQAGEHFLREMVTWAPVCCLAAERDPLAHEFYRALARFTRESLLAAVGPSPVACELPIAEKHQPLGIHGPADDEVRLRDVVRFLLAPSGCGMFLSRARLGMIARGLGLRLPFGSRFEVAEWLFSSAGQNDQVRALIAALTAEVSEWEASYAGWAAQWPAWRPVAAHWLQRLGETRRMLAAMEAIARRALEVEILQL